MQTYNLSNNRDEESNKAMRKAVVMSAYNSPDGGFKYANNKGYVDQNEIDAARYALGLHAEPGDIINVGKRSYRVLAVTDELITMKAPTNHEWRAEFEYTIRWKSKGEPKPRAPKVVKCEVPKSEVEVAEPQPVVAPSAPSVQEPSDLEMALKVLGSYAKGHNPELEARVAAIEEALSEIKANGVGGPSFKIQVNDGPARKVEGYKHKLFDTVHKLARLRLPIYILGPAGTGKTFMARQVAKAEGLKCYVQGSLLQAHELFGYMDANGKYVPTPFYHAFTEGGVYVPDEFDGSAEEVVLKMNSIIENRTCVFPNSEQAVEAHPDFIIIATGNTAMTGPDNRYTARTKMDSSNVNRWIYEEADYDTELETNQTGDAELVKFAVRMRELFEQQSVDLDFTIRDMRTILTYVQIGKSIEDGMTAATGRKLGRMRAKQVASALNMADNKYATAFIKMANSLKH